MAIYLDGDVREITADEKEQDAKTVNRVLQSLFPFQEGQKVTFLGWYWQPAKDPERADFRGYPVAGLKTEDGVIKYLSKKFFLTRTKYILSKKVTLKGLLDEPAAHLEDITQAAEACGNTLVAHAEEDFYSSGQARPNLFGVLSKE